MQTGKWAQSPDDGASEARRTASAAVLLVLALGLAGCAYGSKEMQVTVRDAATAAPVSGAAVWLTPVHLFIPDPIDWMIDPSPPGGTCGQTGPDGTVRLVSVLGVPTRVTAWAPGYELLQVDVVHEPMPGGELRWLIEGTEDQQGPGAAEEPDVWGDLAGVAALAVEVGP